jgi:hypothetical protein
MKFLSECSESQKLAVRFRSVCEDVRNGILACKIVSCVNVTQRNKLLCEIVMKRINNPSCVSHYLNTLYLVVRTVQVTRSLYNII